MNKVVNTAKNYNDESEMYLDDTKYSFSYQFCCGYLPFSYLVIPISA